MSSVQYLTHFVNERLSAAAEEILGVFKKCIVDYEEEIDRQRRLLDIAWKPAIQLHRIVLPHQHVCKEEEEEFPSEQQLCDQERNSSVDKGNPEPPQIKVEQEEPTSQEGEQHVQKQVTGSFMLTPTCETSDISEDETLPLSPDETLSATEEEPAVNISVQSSVVAAPNKDHQLLSHNSHTAESQDHTRDYHANSVSTRGAESEPKKRCQKSNRHSNDTMLKVNLNTGSGKKVFKCDTCGIGFKQKFKLNRHMRVHTGEKPYICKICGKAFRWMGTFSVHMRTHADEQPYSCNACGTRFCFKLELTEHRRTHTEEKPYFCKVCGKSYRWNSNLTLHMRTHTGEKPYTCNTCGKRFCQTSDLTRHIRTHTGEKPYPCKTCGKCFKCNSNLRKHMRTHTG